MTHDFGTPLGTEGIVHYHGSMDEGDKNFWGSPVPNHGFNLIEPIISGLGYKKIARLKAITEPEKSDMMVEIVKASIRGSWAIVFFEGYFADITPYGLSYHLYFSVNNDKRSHYLLHHPELKSDFLRNLFTGMETVIFKLCQMIVYNGDLSYTFEREHMSARLKKLKEHINVKDWHNYFDNFDEILFVRNSFAHSFIRINEIEYKGVPLQICFGKQYNRQRTAEETNFLDQTFMDDVKDFLQPLLDKFEEIQLQQFDREKMFALCDRLIAARSLTR